MSESLFGVVFIVGGTAIILFFVWLFTKYTDMRYDGYPRNPLKWAQESRRQANEARARRISRLEHELGLHADRAEVCIDCDNDKRRAFDQKWLSNEPFDLPYRRRGTSSGGPR
jgi:hypothetical protein